jgi:2-amino-4-hydroxy-6-hydroxymethyldihydropteridine diphosphokinase
MQNRLVLLLGGNLGCRDVVLDLCLTKLRSCVGGINRISGFYETAPWGFDDTVPVFWNCVVMMNTVARPFQVLSITQEIEKELGRTHKAAEIYMSRIIDIDILFFNDDIIESPDLIVPHKGIAERRFVLVPLNEIVSDYIHPVLKKSIRSLLEECKDLSEVIRVRNIKV